MAIPPYTEFMRPMLGLLANKETLSRKEIAENLADHFHLSEEDRSLMLASSPTTALYRSRAGWAVSYLSKAGLLERAGRARYKISSEGRSVLAQNPSSIDLKFLVTRYPDFAAFFRPSKKNSSDLGDDAAAQSETIDALSTPLDPTEQLQAAFDLHRNSLAQDLIDRISHMKPAKFEQLVVQLLLRMGYGESREDAGVVTGGPGDEGIDGVIKQDTLGLNMVYVQAKRWQNTVGRKELQGFVGSLAGKQAQKGVFITTSSFASTVPEYVRTLPNVKVILVDGEQLARYCIDFGVGVQPIKTYVTRRVDLDFFSDDDEI